MPCLVRYVGNSSCLYTLRRLLLVQVLERVFVEIYRSWSEALWGRLRIGSELISDIFHARSDFLSRKQLVHSSAIVGLPQLQLL